VLTTRPGHLVAVHVDERVLRDEAEEGRSHVEGGPSLPPATVRRLCCDGGLVAKPDDRNHGKKECASSRSPRPLFDRRALAEIRQGATFGRRRHDVSARELQHPSALVHSNP
jgi:hypothetical protein